MRQPFRQNCCGGVAPTRPSHDRLVILERMRPWKPTSLGNSKSSVSAETRSSPQPNPEQEYPRFGSSCLSRRVAELLKSTVVRVIPPRSNADKASPGRGALVSGGKVRRGFKWAPKSAPLSRVVFVIYRATFHWGTQIESCGCMVPKEQPVLAALYKRW